MKPIEIKSDKRFKPGHIKQKGRSFRGNPETMKLARLDAPGMINPPIVVGRELGKQIKRLLK